MEQNKRTCLYERHVEMGALVSPFAGFDMPIQYEGIAEEHDAVRTNCGVFDVFGYSVKTIGTKLSGNPDREFRNLTEYVESKKDKRLKEKLNFLPYLLVGAGTILLSFVVKVLL